MAAAWRGTVSFGLVAIPVRAHRATQSEAVALRLLCGECHTPIQNRHWCPEEERFLDWAEIVHGFQPDDGDFVVLSDQDLERLPLPSATAIEIVDVVPDSQVDSELLHDQAYYLEPEPSGHRPYALLQRTLRRRHQSAVGKVAMRTREHLCRISARDRVLVLDTLHFAGELRPADDLRLPGPEVGLSRRELDLADRLLEGLSANFDPSRYHDEYREALLRLIEAKRGRRRLPAARATVPAANVVDLVAVLKQAVEQGGSPRRRSRSRARTRRQARRAS